MHRPWLSVVHGDNQTSPKVVIGTEELSFPLFTSLHPIKWSRFLQCRDLLASIGLWRVLTGFHGCIRPGLSFLPVPYISRNNSLCCCTCTPYSYAVVVRSLLLYAPYVCPHR